MSATKKNKAQITTIEKKVLSTKTPESTISYTPHYKKKWFWIGSLAIIAGLLIVVNTAIIAYQDQNDLVARAANILAPTSPVKTNISSSSVSSFILDPLSLIDTGINYQEPTTIYYTDIDQNSGLENRDNIMPSIDDTSTEQSWFSEGDVYIMPANYYNDIDGR